jgi:hypothetical protein
MDVDFSNNLYLISRGMVSPELVNYLKIQTKLFENLLCIINNKPPIFFNDGQVNNSFSHYSSIFTESLLLFFKDKIEKIVGKELEPTYSYFRIYYNGAELEKHTDRESCEYSATICIKNDENPWDIFFDINGENTKISLNEGDVIMYKGMELPHWREKYEGNEQIQIFLHYVDKNGQYKEHALDKRSALCIQK